MEGSNVFDELKPRIELVNKALMESLDIGEVPSLKEAMIYYPKVGGKRLRPVLAMVVGDAVSGAGEKTLPLGLALEITHNFTLVHDDLMDEDEIRRGIKSLHLQFNDATAINAGDALFARAFEILAGMETDLPGFKQIIKDFSIMVRGIAEGQQLDMEFESRDKVSLEEYMVMIEKKTALMFQMAAKGGTIIAKGDPKLVEAMSEFGRLLGLGFQIWDDLLDLTADEKTLGKPVGSDLVNGKKTLIAVWALENLEGEDRETFLNAFGNLEASKDEVDNAVAVLKSSGALDYARSLALDYTERTKQMLDALPQSREKKLLEELADYMVSRDM